ncbi:MAG TPA: O-methyltransferase [Solirubrobacteraceae bacterium]|nr:O-methyltransferase [Solirubrobacteraceae bacterium]
MEPPSLVAPAATAYAADRTSQFDGSLAAAVGWTSENTPVPGLMSGLAEARLLEALIVIGGASRVLEIGTFTGVGTLTMAAAMSPGGRITTLEVDEDIAAAARTHFDQTPYRGRIELIVGDARRTISELEGPFDLVYIDAWKSDYPAYYDAVLPKLAERGVIVADNLFREGAALDDDARDEGTVGIREFAHRVQQDQSVHNVLLTIGDGVMIVWPKPTGTH